jgi:hypothetical protein
VSPRAVLDAVVKRRIPSPRRESNPRTPISYLKCVLLCMHLNLDKNTYDPINYPHVEDHTGTSQALKFSVGVLPVGTAITRRPGSIRSNN